MRARPTLKYLKPADKYSSRRYSTQVLFLTIIYIGLAKFGLSLAYTVDQATTVWPPTGFALAALLILGYRYWPGVFLGAFFANVLTEASSLVAIGIATGNTLEALAGAYLLNRVIKIDKGFSKIKDFLGLLILSGLVSTIISASFGTVSLVLGDVILRDNYWSTWLVWWIGDMMGAIIFAPLLLILLKYKLAPLRKNLVEATVLIAVTAAVSIFVFSQTNTTGMTLPYLVFPAIIWASLRFTQTGAITIVALIAGIAIWGTANERGPFIHSSSTDQNLIALQTFLMVITATAMIMAIITSQTKRNERALKARSHRLKELNRRITNLLEGAATERSNKK